MKRQKKTPAADPKTTSRRSAEELCAVIDEVVAPRNAQNALDILQDVADHIELVSEGLRDDIEAKKRARG